MAAPAQCGGDIRSGDTRPSCGWRQAQPTQPMARDGLRDDARDHPFPDRLLLGGPNARDELLVAATAQNLLKRANAMPIKLAVV